MYAIVLLSWLELPNSENDWIYCETSKIVTSSGKTNISVQTAMDYILATMVGKWDDVLDQAINCSIC